MTVTPRVRVDKTTHQRKEKRKEHREQNNRHPDQQNVHFHLTISDQLLVMVISPKLMAVITQAPKPDSLLL